MSTHDANGAGSPAPRPADTTPAAETSHLPLKSKFTTGLRALVTGARQLALGAKPTTTVTTLFPRTAPAVDGEACTHDCDSCTAKYPRNFSIDNSSHMYGHVKSWSVHLLVATGKGDWKREVADEKGSVMEAVTKAGAKAADGGRVMLSASDIPVPGVVGGADYSKPTTVLILPAFAVVDNVTPAAVPAFISDIVSRAPTTSSPLTPLRLPGAAAAGAEVTEPTEAGEETAAAAEVETAEAVVDEEEAAAAAKSEAEIEAAEVVAEEEETAAKSAAAAAELRAETPATFIRRPCPHRIVILLCSQKTRDARCGQSAPILRRELERHLRPLGLQRDLDDDRPGGVGIYFISHVGGHKFAANVMVYRRPDPFGLDAAGPEETMPRRRRRRKVGRDKGEEEERAEKDEGERKREDEYEEDVGAGQCIWLARVRPEDCENIVRYTVLRGKVVKPETQLRGGFDRGRGLLSW